MTTLFARYQALIQEFSAVNAARAGLAAAKARPRCETTVARLSLSP